MLGAHHKTNCRNFVQICLWSIVAHVERCWAACVFFRLLALAKKVLLSIQPLHSRVQHVAGAVKVVIVCLLMGACSECIMMGKVTKTKPKQWINVCTFTLWLNQHETYIYLLQRLEHQFLLQHRVQSLHLVAWSAGLKVYRTQHKRSDDNRRQDDGECNNLGDFHRTGLSHRVRLFQ